MRGKNDLTFNTAHCEGMSPEAISYKHSDCFATFAKAMEAEGVTGVQHEPTNDGVTASVTGILQRRRKGSRRDLWMKESAG